MHSRAVEKFENCFPRSIACDPCFRGMGVIQWRPGRAARRLIPLLGVAVLAVTAASAPGMQNRTTLEQVGNKVYCLCGCVTTLNHCPHLPSQCESRSEMTGLIVKDLHQGKSEPAILEDLTRRYGVKVLAAPPTRGFDLAAWLLPGFGLVIGLVVVIGVVSRLRRQPPSGPPPGQDSIDAKVMAAVEEEMKRAVVSEE